MDIRELRLDDMAAAARIHRAAMSNALPRISALHTATEDLAFYRERVFAECRLHGVLHDDALVGFIALRPSWVMQLHVAPGSQRTGVGSALLALAKSEQTELRLWTFQTNTGPRRFYEGQAFVAIEETDGATNEEREPDVLYQWVRS